ncbi:MAG: Flp pilus assembly complex ATPase component TadA [Streptococcaceae bacterium]|jgi:competence protein ComGA|nr:Flp pilus assembly complex ATPase component TadA [Streptococcaceae bacterium]
MKVDDFAKQLFAQAKLQRATDIYLLPSGKEYQLYFRCDNRRLPYQEMSKNDALSLIVHLKFLANMTVGENRRIQLGALNYTLDHLTLRLRISTVGDYRNQESMVIRLLHDFEVDRLCFLHPQQASQVAALIRERGLYLFCGPVGSGKTTLMHYLAIQKFKGQQIVSIEDPVEIENTEMLQLQLNEAIGLSYKELIKLSLRHRPDLLIVGEIRDKLTAKAVIQAALTGHTVFSTIHAKSPDSILARLLELGVSRVELENALKGSIYQRLLEGRDEIGALLQLNRTISVTNEDWNQSLEILAEQQLISKTVKAQELFDS